MNDEINLLRRALRYDPETGVLSWRVTRSPNAQAGQEVGYVDASGYRRFDLGDKKYQTHRVAFALTTGRWPADQIDHRNTIKDDNRWENLREATGTQNQRHRHLQSNNTSGCPGVSWHKRDLRWQATIKIRGRKVQIGSFRKFEDAVAAREAACLKHFGEFARTQPSYLD